MDHNPQIELAREFVERTGVSLFLTGKAGTGKTTFLRKLRENSPKRMIVVAPTGVAAINAGGVTMHSFFQLPFGVCLPDVARREVRRFSKEKIAIIKTLDLLVIDEISMVRADMLDAIDEVLRRFRDRSKPFGGVQLLMIGDLSQLAPVAREQEWAILKDHYSTPLFFDSHALRQTPYAAVELRHIYRQSDERFIDLLAKVRDNNLDIASLGELNSRYRPDFRPSDNEGYITLTSHNNTARTINDTRLAEIDSEEFTFKARISGDFPEHMYPVDDTLSLKLGAQVMFAKNDLTPEHRYVNGTIGVVTQISADRIEVTPAGGNPIIVEPADWENISYGINKETGEVTENIDGVFSQYPLKTAWAITIHKSQGLTFERVVIDAADSFSHGQVYVALSRCKTLEGIVLRSPIPQRAIISDMAVTEFNNAVQHNQPDDRALASHKQAYYKSLLHEMFDFGDLHRELTTLQRQIYRHLYNLYPKLIEKWRDTLPLLESDILSVSVKFRGQIDRLCGEDYAVNPQLAERVIKGAEYFAGKCDEIIVPIVDASRVDIDNKEVKKVVKEITGRLTEALHVKISVLDKAKGGFSVESYLAAKAKAITEKAMPPKEIRTPKQKAETSDDILNPALFALLREWRTNEANKQMVPAFVVLNQKGLIGIVNTIPTSGKELLSIKGIGKKFVERYGAEVLQIVDDYRAGRIDTDDSDIAEAIAEAKAEEENVEQEEKISSAEITYRMFRSGRSPEEIATVRNLSESTIVTHLVPYVRSAEIEIQEVLPIEKLNTILKAMQHTENGKLSETKALLGDEYSYAELNYAKAYQQSLDEESE